MTTFEEDVLSLIGPKPVLVNDLVATLRGGWSAPASLPSGRRWRGVRKDDVERILHMQGAFFAYRPHGSGSAVYVSTEPFNEVVDGRHRVRSVREY